MRARVSTQIDEILADPGSLDRAEHEIIYHHLMTPQPSKGQPEIPTRKSLFDEVHDYIPFYIMRSHVVP